MVKKLLLSVLMIAAGIIICSAAKIDGKWKTSMEGPDGGMELVFTFKVDGEKLTGKIVSPMGDMDLINGKVKGEEFTFDVDMGGTVIKHTCKLVGEEIKMKVDMGDMGGGAPNEMTLKKVE
jgi:hypothetical protein